MAKPGRMAKRLPFTPPPRRKATLPCISFSIHGPDMKFGTGQPVRRREDVRLVTGRARFLADNPAGDALCAAFLRSPVAHGILKRIDTAPALGLPGAKAVLTGADLEADGVNDIGAVTIRDRTGARCPRPKRPLLAYDRVRCVGEPIALVLADSAATARDAAELIEFEIDELPAAAHVEQAVLPDAAQLHPEAADNIAYHWTLGNRVEVEARLAEAAHRVRLSLVNNRVAGCPLETRGATATWDAVRKKLKLEVSAQNAWRVQHEVMQRLDLRSDQVHVRVGDVGGGFGTKAPTYPEYTLVAHAARQLGRPVRWIADRSEAFLSDCMGRDHATRAEAGFDDSFRLQAMKVESDVAMGAYLSPHGSFIPSELVAKVLPGAYDFRHLLFSVRGVYSNSTPVDAYRGAGRPEGIYVIERVMDLAARQFGIDPIELRLRNFVPAAGFPYLNASGETMDSGDYAKVAERARREADIAGFPARRELSRTNGKLRGIGIAFYVEVILGAMDERARIRLAEDGMWELLVGTQAIGGGHETAFLQVLCERTGLDPNQVRLVQGDTDLVPVGGGTGGSRSLTAQGAAILEASDCLVAQLRREAEEEFEAAAADIAFRDGMFRVSGTDRRLHVDELADRIRKRGGERRIDARAHATVARRSFPNGCHVCEAEVDPETGQTRLDRYLAVDDFGRLINPLLVEGQVHGGIAQGFGQAVMEHARFDLDGQLLTGSFMDYALPRAGDLPSFRFLHEPTPTSANPLGVRGCGEAGTIGSLSAVTNAVYDALWQAGVRHVDMPLTPARIWEWLREANSDGARSLPGNERHAAPHGL